MKKYLVLLFFLPFFASANNVTFLNPEWGDISNTAPTNATINKNSPIGSFLGNTATDESSRAYCELFNYEYVSDVQNTPLPASTFQHGVTFYGEGGQIWYNADGADDFVTYSEIVCNIPENLDPPQQVTVFQNETLENSAIIIAWFIAFYVMTNILLTLVKRK